MPAINSFAATRLGSILMLIIALISSAMAALALIKISGQASEFEIVNIVVANQDLKATEIITRDAVALKPYPRESLPQDTFESIDQMFAYNSRPVPTFSFLKNEPISKKHLKDPSKGVGIDTLLQPGERAATLPVGSDVNSARLAYPGARIDILVTGRDPKTKRLVSRIAMQNIEILAINDIADVSTQATQLTELTKAGQAYLVLRLTPEQVEQLVLIQKQGSISISLRGGQDHQRVFSKGTTFEQ